MPKPGDTLDELGLATLANGRLFRFADWPNPEVPHVAYGVYSVWLADGRLLYAGMSGRSELDPQSFDPQSITRKGLWTRLNSHAKGRRSGDQFCIYVCDRLIIPALSGEELEAIGDGSLSLDAKTKHYIHEFLSYRFVATVDGKSAFLLERHVRGGALDAGKPLLNPL